MTSSPDSPARYTRVLGRHSTGRPGPTIVVTGGVHGNEPAGCEAMLRVLRRLARDALPLNRRWIREDIARIVANGPEAAIEDREQLELLGILAPLLDQAREAIVFFDLHSTSGPAAPFSCMADVLRNRKIARALPIPVVLGLEEVIDGSLLGYLCDLGHIGVAVEGGQHTDPPPAPSTPNICPTSASAGRSWPGWSTRASRRSRRSATVTSSCPSASPS